MDPAADSLIPEHTYHWKPLTTSNSFRLFPLEGALDSQAPLCGTLTEVDLSEDIVSYETLSYACGDYAPKVKLYCEDSNYVLITETLASALREFRHLASPLREFQFLDKTRLLWIDIVYIDQANLSEKNNQVGKLMHKIFQSATTVLAWLGPADEDTPRAFEILNRQSEHGESYDLGPDNLSMLIKISLDALRQIEAETIPDEHSGSILASVLSREWFGRRWVVQEVILAQDLFVHRGTHKLSWTCLAQAEAILQNIYGLANNTKLERYEDNSLGSLITYRTQWRGFIHGGVSQHDYFSLKKLMRTFAKTGCRDPRDKVYALLSGSKEPFIFRVDYSEDESSTYRRLTDHYLFDIRNLTVLNYANTGRSKCSYVPDWSKKATKGKTTYFSGNASPIKFPGGLRAGMGQSLKRECEICRPTSSRPIVTGSLIDTVHAVHRLEDAFERARSEGLIMFLSYFLSYEKCLREHRHEIQNVAYEDLSEAFARTARLALPWKRGELFRKFVLTDNILALKQGQLQLIEAMQMNKHILNLAAKHDLYRKSYNEAWEIKEDRDVCDDWDTRVIQYLSIAMLLSSCTSSFAILKNGHLGSVAEKAQPDDIVCIFYGAETPFVLRPVDEDGKPVDATEDYTSGKYRFIGEYYIHGTMLGEYIGSEEDKKWFELF